MAHHTQPAPPTQQPPNTSTLLAQALRISMRSFIRNIAHQVINDCEKRTGSPNPIYFLQNCESILYQQGYFPTFSSRDIQDVCNKYKSQPTQQPQKCSDLSHLVQLYLVKDMDRSVKELLKYSTSDGFIQVLYDNFIQNEWDLS